MRHYRVSEAEKVIMSSAAMAQEQKCVAREIYIYVVYMAINV